MTTKRFFKKTGKIIGYTLLGLVVLIIATWIFINTDYGKRIVRNKIQSYLETKLKTKVVIGGIDYSLPKWVELKNIYIEDQKKDTLLVGEKLAVEIDMLKLINGNTFIRKVELKNIFANVYRNETDSFFNYQFILDAFAGNKSDAKVDKDTAAMKLTLKELVFDNVRLKYSDKNAGSDMTAYIKDLDTKLTKFQPDRLQFDIDKFVTDGLDFSMTTYKDLVVDHGPVDTTKESPYSLLLSAGLLDLRNVNVAIDNKVNGMYYNNNLKHFSLDNINLDLAKEKATANAILMDSSLVKFISPKADLKTAVDTTVAASSYAWNIKIKNVKLNNDQFQFDNNAIAAQAGFDPSHLDMQGIKINAADVVYVTDSILATVTQLAFKDKGGFILDTTHANIAYTNKGITASELYIKTPQSVIQNTVSIKYDDIKQLTTMPQNSSVDIKLQNTIIAINDIYTLMPSAKKFLDPQKFTNNLVKLNTNVDGTLQRLNIPFLQMAAFDGTVINAKAILYNVTDSSNLGYDITVFNSSIPKSDLLKFLPGSKNAMAKLPPVINISTSIKGNLNNTTGSFNISSSTFTLNANGVVKNLKDPKALQYDVAIKDSKVDKSFITSIMPPNTLPQSIELPQTIILNGTAKGDMNNIQPNLKLSGSYGIVAVKGYVRNFKNAEAASYDLQFATNDFAVGKLIKQDSVIGNFTLTGSAKGRGFDYKTMQANIKANIQSAGFNKYNYQNATLSADLNHGNINSVGNIDDLNLRMNYTAAANVAGKYPSNVEATLAVDTIQLEKLHLYKDSLNAKFKLYVKAPNTDPDNLDIYAYTDSSRINVKNKNYILDSIIAKANTNNGVNNLSLRSPFADVKADGKFEYDKIGQSLSQYINKYYNIQNTAPQALPAQQISFEGTIKKHALVTDLVPGLSYENIPFKGSYASQGGDSALNLHATIPHFAYDKEAVSNGNIDIVTINDKINGVVNFDTLRFANNIFYKTNITANAANDSIGIAMLTKDVKNVDRYGIGANIKIDNETYNFSLKQKLILNYKSWDVKADNRITYSPQGVLVKDFVISSDSASIAANSRGGLNSPVDVAIDNFNIKEVTAFLSKDTLLASGILNAKFAISDFQKTLPSFTGDLTLSKFEFLQQPVGDIKMTADKKDDNAVTATMTLAGNGNDMAIKGSYYLNDPVNEFDANLDIKQLKLATLQAFSGGSLVRSSGGLSGNIALKGKFADPRWNGELSFDTAKFTIAQLGTPYLIDKQKITLNYPDLSFNKFTVKDSTGHSLVVDGSMKERSLSEFDLNLSINAKNFTLVNAPKAINNQLYGFAAIDADMTIRGSSTSPDIEGNLSLNDKTDLTIVLPESNINKDAARSVVRFIDRDTFDLPEKILFKPANEAAPSFGQFLNYNLNIEVTKKAALTLIIDPSTGDALKVQGDAQLNAGVNPAGNLILSGNYELSKGYYDMHYQFINRRFDLLPASTITFSGEPTEAQINISAQYIANTSARDLLQNEVGEVDAKTANTFNQKIPFRVLLYLKGSIKKPEISFDIQLPDENTQLSSNLRTTIENKLVQLRSDVAGTNKQVFSLLLLNRFVGEQSSDFFKGNGGSFDELARESVSKFLSSALDQIAGDLFKGVNVDLNLNSYEDYSTGDQQQRTDLNVAVSKSFLDDRLTVTVGTNFGIEGQTATSQKPSTIPDVTVNYKLTKDGKYSLRAYKKNQFEVVMDGYVVETGVAFVLTMDYDKFKELFQKKKK